ncbi:hypothetical protein U8U95_12460 [Enterococcus faecium]|nr:hypothetical protein [Enterococcus faecium]
MTEAVKVIEGNVNSNEIGSYKMNFQVGIDGPVFSTKVIVD